MSKYYTAPPQVKNGDVAYAVDVNGLNDGADTGFALVEADILGISATVEAWALLAQKWAENPVDVEVEPGMYSSLHHSDKSSGFADASQVSANASEASNVASGISAAESAASAAEALQTLQDVEDEGDVQVARVIAEGDTQDARVIAEGDTQEARVIAEGNTQDARVVSEGDTQEARVIAEGTTQVSRVIAEGDTQEARVIAEGTNQVSLATAQAERAEDAADAAEGWSNLSESYSIDSANSALQSLGHANNAYQYSLDAQSVACQDLTAIQKEIATSANVVDVYRYDTADDTDGGAWRKRTESLSWYKEDLNTATRGKTREFPSVSLIVAETDKVIIYDATDPLCPMWMVANRHIALFSWISYATASSATAISMSNGVLTIGSKGTSTSRCGACIVNFISDRVLFARSVENTQDLGSISTRNDGIPIGSGASTQIPLVSSFVNKVAMIVLPDSPIDQTTGIQVPTIAVATDGGVSVIDGPAGVGTVVDITWSDASWKGAYSVSFGDDGSLIVADGINNGTNTQSVHIYNDIPTSDLVSGVQNYTKGASDRFYRQDLQYSASLAHGSGKGAISIEGAIGGVDGLTLLKENPQSPSEGMVNYITTDYQSGWMQGDIKLGTLADITAETIGTDTTTEHVTNGTFDTDLSNWSNDNNFWQWSAGRAYHPSGDVFNKLMQDMGFIEGQVYELTFDVEHVSGGDWRLQTRDSSGGVDGVLQVVSSDTGTFTYTFKANATTAQVMFARNSLGVATEFYVDNISVKAIQNLVENGEFSSDRAWTKQTGWSVGSGVASCDGSQGTASSIYQSTGLDGGKRVLVTFTVSGRTQGSIRPFIGTSGTGTYVSSDGTYSEVLEVTDNTDDFIRIQADADFIGSIDNVIVEELQVPDRSVNDNPLQVVGQIEKVPVATGSELVAYSGFSANDYIEQPYNADLDFGTGDFYVMGWFTQPPTTARKQIYDRTDGTTHNQMRLETSGVLRFFPATGNAVDSNTVCDTGDLIYFCAYRQSGLLYMTINGALENGGTSGAGTVTIPDSTLLLGAYTGGIQTLDGDISLFRIGAGAPSDEQIKYIYDTEKHLFEEDAKCTLQGSSDSVKAVDYDEVTDKLYASTADGTTSFQGSVVVDDIDSGDTNSVSVGNGAYLYGNSVGSSYYQPAYNLREELQRKDEQIALLGQPLQSYESSQTGITDYALGEGWYPESVYQAGLLERKVNYGVEYDGFQHHVVFVAPTTGAIHVMLRRIA